MQGLQSFPYYSILSCCFLLDCGIPCFFTFNFIYYFRNYSIAITFARWCFILGLLINFSLLPIVKSSWKHVLLLTVTATFLDLFSALLQSFVPLSRVIFGTQADTHRLTGKSAIIYKIRGQCSSRVYI